MHYPRRCRTSCVTLPQSLLIDRKLKATAPRIFSGKQEYLLLFTMSYTPYTPENSIVANDRELRVTGYVCGDCKIESSESGTGFTLDDFMVTIPHGIRYVFEQKDSNILTVPLNQGIEYVCTWNTKGCMVEVRRVQPVDEEYPPTVPLPLSEPYNTEQIIREMDEKCQADTWSDFQLLESLIGPKVTTTELALSELVAADRADVPPLDEIAEFPTDCIEVIQSPDKYDDFDLNTIWEKDEETKTETDSESEGEDLPIEYMEDYDTFYDQ